MTEDTGPFPVTGTPVWWEKTNDRLIARRAYTCNLSKQNQGTVGRARRAVGMSYSWAAHVFRSDFSCSLFCSSGADILNSLPHKQTERHACGHDFLFHWLGSAGSMSAHAVNVNHLPPVGAFHPPLPPMMGGPHVACCFLEIPLSHVVVA